MNRGNHYFVIIHDDIIVWNLFQSICHMKTVGILAIFLLYVYNYGLMNITYCEKYENVEIGMSLKYRNRRQTLVVC